VNDSDIPGASLDSQLLTLLGHAAVPAGLKDAMQKSPGAQFYKCAFQLNSFGYLARHSKPTSFTTEATYNTAVVEACRRENVHVVSITDHFRIATARGLAKALTDAGIHLFPGFQRGGAPTVPVSPNHAI
jgi:hypothetical protein